MIEGCNEILLRYFSAEAAEFITEELNRQAPRSLIELSEILGNLGVDAIITLYDDFILVTNMTGLFDEFKEDEGVATK